ncbi:MAG: class I SAM-dependent methyltransferase [Pseudolabrys sp.]
MFETARARMAGAYALHGYLPASQAARTLRNRLRRLRGRAQAPALRLAQKSWSQVLPNHPIRLTETEKSDGNVRLSELAILALAASQVPAAREIIEIGTFDGRTALNLAINAPRGVSVMTLDLPPDQASALEIEASERRYVDKPAPGARLRGCADFWRSHAGRVTQMQGDSATFDWSPHFGRAGLVFVDGSHAYDYVRKDSETAMKLVMPGDVVLWHDYGVWPGVNQALEELEAAKSLGLVNITGTSLVFWRAPGGPAGQA